MDEAEIVEVWGRVIRGVGMANRTMHALIRRRFSLNEAEVDTLVTLGGAPDGRASMAVLAASAAFTTGGYTKVADRLERRGALRRVRDPQDGRVTYLELTPSGQALAQALRDVVAEVLNDGVVGVMGEELLRTMAAGADALRDSHENRKAGPRGEASPLPGNQNAQSSSSVDSALPMT